MLHIILDFYNSPRSCLIWLNVSLRKKCPYSELFWSVFSRIQTEYGEILRISSYSVRMRENADHDNSEYGHFSRRLCVGALLFILKFLERI